MNVDSIVLYNLSMYFPTEKNDLFIALIHPIQWTIANLVLLVHYETLAGWSHYAFATWHIVIPSCLDNHDVIASFLFSVSTVQTEICRSFHFEVFSSSIS